MSSSSTSRRAVVGDKSDVWDDKSAKDYGSFAVFTRKFAQSAVDQAVEALEEQQQQRSQDDSSAGSSSSTTLRCLDIAAGTGAATFTLLDTLCRQRRPNHNQNDVSIVATDLSRDMLEQLEQQIPQALDPHQQHPNNKHRAISIETKVCDMQTLEGIPDSSVDLCTMVFGIMFSPDMVVALRQVKRVLAPHHGVAVITSWTWNSMMQDLNVFLHKQGKISNMSDFCLSALLEGTDREYSLRMAALQAGFDPQQISVTYITHDSFPMNAHTMAESHASNPLLAQYLPLDAAKLEEYFLSFDDGEDERGPVRLVAGTALCLRIGF